jgi:hypothetical protein
MAVDVGTLTNLITDEIIKAMGLSRENPVGRWLRPIFAGGTRHFSELFAEVDRIVGETSLAEGARALLPHLVTGYEVLGAENIPPEGPLVVASNHPGTVDSVVITAGVSRPDFKIVAGAIPFLQHLPSISKHLIFTPQNDPHARMNVVRESLRHLEHGGSLLLFGRGRIDPDPAFMPHPDETLPQWSRSLEIFLDRVPQAQVLVTIVSGVILPRFMHHPLTWLRRAREDRQRLAMMVQIIQQMLGKKIDLTARVTFGDLISEEKLGGRERMLPTIVGSARNLMVTHLRQV